MPVVFDIETRILRGLVETKFHDEVMEVAIPVVRSLF
jgi:hypothetical protein